MLDARESIIIKTLQRLPREDVVMIGGYAVNAYVPPRFSIDCDLVVLGSSSKIESLLKEDMFMLAGADLNWDLISEVLSAKCSLELMGKRGRSISRDVQSKSFRDSLQGPFGRIPKERFELCKRRLVEYLKTVNPTSGPEHLSIVI